MYEFEMPEDLPRLWTIKQYLILQLEVVNKAREAAEHGHSRPAGQQLPPDHRRLWTIKWYLMLNLAQVDKAIREAENGTQPTRTTEPQWVLMGRFTPKGTDRLLTLHAADCWRAAGHTLTDNEVRDAHRPGRHIEPCDMCKPIPPDTTRPRTGR